MKRYALVLLALAGSASAQPSWRPVFNNEDIRVEVDEKTMTLEMIRGHIIGEAVVRTSQAPGSTFLQETVGSAQLLMHAQVDCGGEGGTTEYRALSMSRFPNGQEEKTVIKDKRWNTVHPGTPEAAFSSKICEIADAAG